MTALALAHKVDRKTLRRRLDALAHAEAERAQRIAATRLRRQAAAERQTPPTTRASAPAAHEHAGRAADQAQPLQPTAAPDPQPDRREQVKEPLRPRRLSPSGLVRVGNPDGSIQQWVEPALVDDLLEQGWTHA